MCLGEGLRRSGWVGRRWVGLSLSRADQGPEVSAGALGKSYTFYEVLIAHL